MYCAGHNKLYARDERDNVISFAPKNQKTVLQANELLADLKMQSLIDNGFVYRIFNDIARKSFAMPLAVC